MRLEDRNKMGSDMVEEIISGKMATLPLMLRAIDMSFTGLFSTSPTDGELRPPLYYFILVPQGQNVFIHSLATNLFTPYFGSEEGPAHFAAVLKILGASNAFKLLLHIPMKESCQVIVTISYEAEVAGLQAELEFMQAQPARCRSSGSASASAIYQVMFASSYSQRPHQVPSPYHTIRQPYNPRVLAVKGENACGFANSIDCKFLMSPSDNFWPQMKVLQRCRNLDKTGVDSEALEDLAGALLLTGTTRSANLATNLEEDTLTVGGFVKGIWIDGDKFGERFQQWGMQD